MRAPLTSGRGALAAGAIALLIALPGLFFLFARPAPEFDFVEMTSPAGFRRVALEGQSTGFDALAGVADPDAAVRAAGEDDICSALYADPLSPVTGDPSAAISIASFSDYRCPYCRVLTKILADIAEAGTARIVHKEWPIFGAASALGARAALAANSQGAFALMHARLMRSAFMPTPAYLRAISDEMGIDAERLLSDMRSGDVDRAVADATSLAARLGLRGTPTLVIGRTIVEGAVTRRELDALIEITRRAGDAQACAPRR
jgi:protein-disulfide isomerase